MKLLEELSREEGLILYLLQICEKCDTYGYTVILDSEEVSKQLALLME
jgi:hypothetical protein